MTKKLLTLALALTALTACEPSHTDINEMIKKIPADRRHQLQLAYDYKLLEGYEKGKSLEEAHKYAHQFIPNKETDAAGYYFTARHANYRFNQSCEGERHYRYGSHKLKNSYMVYTFYPDFPEKLRAEVMQNAEKISSQNVPIPTHESTHQNGN